MLFNIIQMQSLAYLDPNTGSILIQGIVASLAVVGLGIKVFSSKIKTLFGKKSEDEEYEE